MVFDAEKLYNELIINQSIRRPPYEWHLLPVQFRPPIVCKRRLAAENAVGGLMPRVLTLPMDTVRQTNYHDISPLLS